ncbi:hypothetical protein CVIRNUC_007686 [Coccomyxa viridis]|uniref:BZIP domain-containing protein n=1 Tax=Coccomyxa viridis TaxID=1274662 RepID=A0AAV1IE61_9CHLO|nr:hypothetical protein CVIRNUC_007686 [Coccomyxa viridis]
MTASSVCLQAACVQGTDPYMQQWAAPDLVDLESLPMQPGSHGKHHSPMEDSITDFGGDNPDYLKLLEEDFMTSEQPTLTIFNESLTSHFLPPPVELDSPNLGKQGIAQHAPHSDTLTHDSHIQAPAPPHSLLNIQQRALPPINIKQPSRGHMHEVEREQQGGRPGRFEARARPQTAMPALHTVTTAPAHMPVLPGRPQEIPRTRSWPAASNLQPLQYARGAPVHEAQSHHPPPGRIRRTLAAEGQTHQREAMAEGSPGSPPKRKGKGGRQRAPPPDATVDPKKAKRIMANRESAARSKEKQKKNAERLDNEAKERGKRICAMRHHLEALHRRIVDRKHRLRALCAGIEGAMPDHDQEKKANSYWMRELIRLRDSIGISSRGPNAGNSGQRHCQLQHGHMEGPLNVHANCAYGSMAPMPFDESLPDGPYTPELEPFQAQDGDSLRLSDSFPKAFEGSSSPPERQVKSEQSVH